MRAVCQTDLARHRNCHGDADPGRPVAADSPGNPPIRRVDLSATRPSPATRPVWATRARPPLGGPVRSTPEIYNLSFRSEGPRGRNRNECCSSELNDPALSTPSANSPSAGKAQIQGRTFCSGLYYRSHPRFFVSLQPCANHQPRPSFMWINHPLRRRLPGPVARDQTHARTGFSALRLLDRFAVSASRNPSTPDFRTCCISIPSPPARFCSLLASA